MTQGKYEESVEEMTEVGKLEVSMGTHGNEGHSIAGRKLWHGAEKDEKYGCWDDTTPIWNGEVCKK